MVIELVLNFRDDDMEGEEEPIEFSHTLTAPVGFEVTGGQIFVERLGGGDLDRFSFRIDREQDGSARLTILEDVNA